MHYTLKEARSTDREWLETLRRAAYEELFFLTWGGWDEERHQRHFADSWRRGGIQLVEVGDQPVGMIQLDERDDCVELVEVQLLPEKQSLGLGTRLVVDIVDRARAQGRPTVLSTGLMNTRAQSLYRRLGFEEIARDDSHVHMRSRERVDR